MSETNYCDTSLVYLGPINKQIARQMIEKNH